MRMEQSEAHKTVLKIAVIYDRLADDEEQLIVLYKSMPKTDRP